MTNKKEIVAKVAEAIGETKVKTEMFLNTLIEVIQNELVDGDGVKLAGLGTLKKTVAKERNAVNPSTGEKIVVPAKNRVTLKVAKELKELINK